MLAHHKYIFAGNKECPTCRKKLVSKRSLRPDPNFDQLVSKLFPDRDDTEEQQEKAGFVHAKRLCKKRKLSNETEGTDLDLADEDNKSKKNSLVNFKLICHEDMPEDIVEKLKQRERFVETSSSATIQHVKAYVKTRLTVELDLKKMSDADSENKNCDLPEITSIKLFTKTSETDFKLLEDKVSLHELLKDKDSDYLELYFSAQTEVMGSTQSSAV